MSRFKHKLRVRSCGIIVENQSVVLVLLNAPTQETPFWTIPGGGVQVGESLQAAVEREVFEETGLEVRAEKLAATSEFIKAPFHAIEFYWYCNLLGGNLHLGSDPEQETDPIIQDVKWIPVDNLTLLEVQPHFLPDLIRDQPQGISYFPSQ